MFRSNCYVFIIVNILLSVKKYHLYNSLIAVRKRKGFRRAQLQVSQSSYAKFQVSRFLGFRVRALAHKSSYILFYLLDV